MSNSSNSRPSFERPLLDTLLRRLSEPRRFVQVLGGPRQVGKTTLARQLADRIGVGVIYASADGPLLEDRAWLEGQWERGRLAARSGPSGALLVLDEVQKVRGWSEVVKRLWDEDTAGGVPLRVLVLGSSALLVEKGLADSLAGRFERVRATHWSFPEMEAAFGTDLERFVYYGAYPGAWALLEEPERWRRYILDSLVETTLSRDILLLCPVEKPHLLRRLFHLACASSGQIVSYQKMLGQLQDVGNTTTLAHYLHLLEGAGLVAGVPKFSAGLLRQRASSPKLQVLNAALLTAVSGPGFDLARADRPRWGRLVESAVGAHLLNKTAGTDVQVSYWRERNHEVDFVLERGKTVLAIEVKSGASKPCLPGLGAFRKAFPGARPLLVGEGGLPLEQFLRASPIDLLREGG